MPKFAVTGMDGLSIDDAYIQLRGDMEVSFALTREGGPI